jgi:transcriptional regulator with XRE-family HTH domain
VAFSPEELGQRIRALRKRGGLTLSELSRRSGVSVSTLSKLENGQATASVDTIFKVARGLEVFFANLIDIDRPSAAVGRWTVTRASEGERFVTTHYDYSVHAVALVEKQMVPLIMRIKTREPPAPEDWSTHPGEEFVLVLSGTVELRTEYYAPARLAPGDSAYFDSMMRHCFVAVSGEEPQILSMCLSDHAQLREQLDEAQERAAFGFVRNGAEARREPVLTEK